MTLIKRIARYKIYLDRSRTYAAYIQLLLLIKLVLSDVGIDSTWMVLGGLGLCMCIFMFVGYLDTRLGIRSREMEDNGLKNPILMEILKNTQKWEK